MEKITLKNKSEIENYEEKHKFLKENNMTAVQELKYLFNDILKDRGVSIAWDTYLAQEKQQIIDAHVKGQNHLIEGSRFEEYRGAEKYYNETYGSKGSETKQ